MIWGLNLSLRRQVLRLAAPDQSLHTPQPTPHSTSSTSSARTATTTNAHHRPNSHPPLKLHYTTPTTTPHAARFLRLTRSTFTSTTTTSSTPSFSTFSSTSTTSPLPLPLFTWHPWGCHSAACH
eukprot:6016525-Amphidinium_carterae.1